MHSHQETSGLGDLFPYLATIRQENKKLRKILFLSFLDRSRGPELMFQSSNEGPALQQTVHSAELGAYTFAELN